MNLIISSILSFILLLLSLLHFYWAFGGQWAFEESLPTNKKGQRVLNPKKLDSIVVGLGLLCFSLYYLISTKLIGIDLPDWLIKFPGWIIPGIFMLRAIGDFRYVGFFKKIKTTHFGKWDTKFHSPLCFFIGVGGIVLMMIN